MKWESVVWSLRNPSRFHLSLRNPFRNISRQYHKEQRQKLFKAFRKKDTEQWQLPRVHRTDSRESHFRHYLESTWISGVPLAWYSFWYIVSGLSIDRLCANKPSGKSLLFTWLLLIHNFQGFPWIDLYWTQGLYDNCQLGDSGHPWQLHVLVGDQFIMVLKQ